MLYTVQTHSKIQSVPRRAYKLNTEDRQGVEKRDHYPHFICGETGTGQLSDMQRVTHSLGQSWELNPKF